MINCQNTELLNEAYVPMLTKKGPSVLLTPSNLELTSTFKSSDDMLSQQVSFTLDHAKYLLEKLKDNSKECLLNGRQKIDEIRSSHIDQSFYSVYCKAALSNTPASIVTPVPESYDLNDSFCKHDTSLGINKYDLMNVLDSLMLLLTKSQEQIKQLKLKNLILGSNIDDTNSRHKVEADINNQQFERIKSRLLVENQDLTNIIRTKDSKVSKYKDKIIEKNKEINRLTRLLNETMITGNLHINSMPPLSNSSYVIKKSEQINQTGNMSYKDSNMLTTLGILASKVLNEGQILESKPNVSPKINTIDFNSTAHTENQMHIPDTTIKVPYSDYISDSFEDSSTLYTPISENKYSDSFTKLKNFNSVNGSSTDT